MANSYGYYQHAGSPIYGQVVFSSQLDENKSTQDEEKIPPKIETVINHQDILLRPLNQIDGRDKKDLELGLEIECLGMRYMLTRYDYKDLGFEKKPGDKVLKQIEKEERSAYLINNLPQLKWKEARIKDDDTVQNFIDRSDLANSPLLLRELRVYSKGELSETLEFHPKPNFKLFKLKDALKCSHGSEKNIELDIVVLKENKAVLTVQKWNEQQKDREEKKLWKILKSGSGTDKCKVIILRYEMKSSSMRPEWRNLIRTPAPKPGLKEEFDLTEASEKVIIMLSRVMLTNTWATLSPNIYGELSFSSIETDIHCYYTNPFAR